MQSAERVSHEDVSDNFVFRRSELAYRRAAWLVSGDVLEIGTGSGYGIAMIAPHARTFTTVDKHAAGFDTAAYPNVEFHRMRVPPLAFPDNSFDFVIMFQVIEHIGNDRAMIAEIHRVLRPGGRLIVTTPNKPVSLTRNPWHVREYTGAEFSGLLGSCFGKIEGLGVFGRENVMEYYENNRRTVARIARYDVLRLRKWLPRFIYRVPYDIMNRRNRRRLLESDTCLAAGITTDDYYLAPVGDGCFDLFYVAEK